MLLGFSAHVEEIILGLVEALCGEVTLCEKSLLGELAQGPVHDKGIVAELFGACAGSYFRGDLIWAARLTDNKVKQKKGKMVAGALKSGLNISFMNVELRVKD